MATVTVRPDRVEPRLLPVGRRAVLPIRVLVVFNSVALYGMERQVIELFDLLRPEVEPHFLLSYTTRRRQLPLLVEIERRGLKHSFFSDQTDWPKIGRPRSLRHAWRMIAALYKGNRDVLHCARGCDAIYLPAWGYGFFALLAASYAWLAGKRVVYCFHDLPHRWHPWLRVISTLVTHCVHLTRFGYDFAVHTNPYLARKNTTVCATRTQSQRLCDPDSSVRPALEGKRNLLFIGQLTYIKGFDILLDAFHMLASSYPDVHLQVLGTSPDEQQVRDRVASMGLESRVHLWGYRENVNDFLDMAYAYIQSSPPSRVHEAFGRGATEAMACAVPVICFRSGALREIVVHEGTGLICEEDDAACLARNICRLLDNRQLRSSCASGALSRYQSLYSDEVIRKHWIQFFSYFRSDAGMGRLSREPAAQ